jgi:Na+/glutamate symporter
VRGVSGVQCSDVRRCGAVCLDVCVCYSLISASCSAGSERALLYRCAAAVAACVCVRVCVCVVLRFIGRSLRLSAAVVAQQRRGSAGV